MRLSGEAWDGWDWQASWLHFPGYLIAVGGNFGFFAPVLAKQAPAALDAIAQYGPVVVINGLAAIA
jgi:hypothetical protein